MTEQQLAAAPAVFVIDEPGDPEDGGCWHDWMLRPESDTHECLVCGAER